MSILPIEPDIHRHCFSPCQPGTFCECQGQWIAGENSIMSDEDKIRRDLGVPPEGRDRKT